MATEAWLRLALAPEVGPVLGHRLLAALGEPEAVFAAPEARLRAVDGLGPARLARLRDGAIARLAREEAQRAAREGVRLVTLADEEYPPLLRRLPCPPLVLWVRGRIAPADRLGLAIVGPRNPSAYARLMTGRLAGPLAAHGLTLVSGLAYGIDGQVHREALEAGGRTLAVVGQGLGTALYPQAHAELAERIVQEDRGAIVSIFPMATEPAPGLFPARNEVIAGLALGVLVVEASRASGSLITARHALAAERHVMACPGDATRRAAEGSNRLIADGAPLVQTHEDVLAAMSQDLRREMDELGLDGPEGAGAAEGSDEDGRGEAGVTEAGPADALARLLLELLAEEPLPADALFERCDTAGHGMSAVVERLLQLEIEGRVRQMPGRLYALRK